jgi:hypothetical protein
MTGLGRVCHTNLAKGQDLEGWQVFIPYVVISWCVSKAISVSYKKQSPTSIHPVIVTKLQDIGALKFGFIAKRAENGIGRVKEVQNGIKFRHLSVIHDDDMVVMGL